MAEPRSCSHRERWWRPVGVLSRDISRCDVTPGLWGDPGGRGIYGDDQVDWVWILDVDGRRLVVNAAYSRPMSTASDIDKLTSMVESLEFVAAARE